MGILDILGSNSKSKPAPASTQNDDGTVKPTGYSEIKYPIELEKPDLENKTLETNIEQTPKIESPDNLVKVDEIASQNVVEPVPEPVIEDVVKKDTVAEEDLIPTANLLDLNKEMPAAEPVNASQSDVISREFQSPPKIEKTKLPQIVFGTELKKFGEKAEEKTPPMSGAPVKEEPNNIAKEVKVEKEPAKTKNRLELKTIKNIGFIGLNSNLLNNGVSEELRELAFMLSEQKASIFIDSNKGYGLSVIEGAKRASVKHLTGIYFKPYFSNYSDFAEINIGISEYSQYLYSNYLDRLKSLVKNVDLFIVPETSGVINTAQIFTVWGLSNLYLGQNKPIILIGKQWNDTVTVLKDSLKLNTQEIQSIEIAHDAGSAIDIIMKMEKLYSGKVPVNVKKTFDMRSESEETESFMDI